SLSKDNCPCTIAFFFQAEDGIRDRNVTGVQTCALPISVVEPSRAFAQLLCLCYGHRYPFSQSAITAIYGGLNRTIGYRRYWLCRAHRAQHLAADCPLGCGINRFL